MGLSQRQFAALVGAGYAMGEARNCSGLFCMRTTFSSEIETEPATQISNIFFTDLLGHHTFEETATSDGGNTMYMVRQEQKLNLFLYQIFDIPV